jgi:NAD-dependent dihydropyrimidine dehydrogenase PreA subunit
MAHYIEKNCTRCAACLPECPTESIISAEPIFLIDADTCTDCMACIPVCPVEAIRRLNLPAKNAALPKRT